MLLGQNSAAECDGKVGCHEFSTNTYAITSHTLYI